MSTTPGDEYVPNYDIPPGVIAHLDGQLLHVAADLDTLIASFRFHAARVDDTIAFAVLAENVSRLVHTGQLDVDVMCLALALAVQRLAKESADV